MTSVRQTYIKRSQSTLLRKELRAVHAANGDSKLALQPPTVG